jgi:hypothetical protein
MQRHLVESPGLYPTASCFLVLLCRVYTAAGGQLKNAYNGGRNRRCEDTGLDFPSPDDARVTRVSRRIRDMRYGFSFMFLHCLNACIDEKGDCVSRKLKLCIFI